MTHLTNKLLSASIKGSLTGWGIPTTGGEESVSKVENLISSIIGVLTVVGIIYFVIQIILAGYTLISSKGDPKKFEIAQSKLIHDVIGLLLVVVALGVTAFIAKLLGVSNIFNLKTSLPTVTK